MDLALPKDFKEFLKLLNANGVRYLLIGGFAVGFHGHPRATNDLDIFVADDEANAERLVKTLADFTFQAENLSTELFTKQKSLIEIGVEPIKIEIINYASGLQFEHAYRNRIIGIIDETEISLISLNDLKINKKAAGRYKDLDDLEHLS